MAKIIFSRVFLAVNCNSMRAAKVNTSGVFFISESSLCQLDNDLGQEEAKFRVSKVRVELFKSLKSVLADRFLKSLDKVSEEFDARLHIVCLNNHAKWAESRNERLINSVVLGVFSLQPSIALGDNGPHLSIDSVSK